MTLKDRKTNSSQLKYDELLSKWEEDQEVFKVQKERIQALLEDNHHLMSMISALKMDLKDVQNEFDSLSKSVRLLFPETQGLDNLLSEGKIKSNKKDLGYLGKNSYSENSSKMFVRASNSKSDGVVVP